MLRLMRERDELSIVADQFGSPTWADSLAEVIWGFGSAAERSGVFHWSDAGQTNWQEFALAIQEEALSLGLLETAIPIHAIKTEDYRTAATRPAYSVLDCSSTIEAINMHPAEWRTNLRQMLKEMAE
jgi:dTDP-4-dehydrorhamnose reductase